MIIDYLLKFSISLAVLFIFYRFVLAPLTFYQWNRFYLLGYSMLSFFIPFIDIGGWISQHSSASGQYITIIPSIGQYASAQESGTRFPSWPGWDTALIIVFVAGLVFMLFRMAVQLFSLNRLRKQSKLVSDTDGVRLYETLKPLSPFSFGKSIFVNPKMHAYEELERIIQHEFVHVRQKHTLDILVGELLCMVNWFNPFAWLIRHAIRQNLEFIADSQVISAGYARKEYQYLLLKVIGQPQYAFVSHFNFSNLKKRIAMMNKLKSSPAQLSKFLFVLPVLGLSLLAFRSSQTSHESTISTNALRAVVEDTVPPKPPAPPAVQSENVPPKPPVSSYDVKPTAPPPPPPPPAKRKLPEGVKSITVQTERNEKGGDDIHRATVILSSGKKEVYNLGIPSQKDSFEKKYGSIQGPPPVPAQGLAPITAEPVAPLAPISADAPKAFVVPDGVVAPSKPDPLIIVDGTIMPDKKGLSEIDPNSISSIDVLKDKKATEVYGSAGANGVIIVTTRKHSLPENVLIVLDGKKLPAGMYKTADDVVKKERISSITVLNEKQAVLKYGDDGNHGAIEIATKKL